MSCFDGSDDGLDDAVEVADYPDYVFDDDALTRPQFLTCRAYRRRQHRYVRPGRDTAATVIGGHWARAEKVAQDAYRAACITADEAHDELLPDGAEWTPDELRQWAALDEARTAAGWRYQFTAGRGREVTWQLHCRLTHRPVPVEVAEAVEHRAVEVAELRAELAVEQSDERRRRTSEPSTPVPGAPPVSAHLSPHAPPARPVTDHCHARRGIPTGRAPT